jgi:metal-sulfur cluster biosynthetic enzyme
VTETHVDQPLFADAEVDERGIATEGTMRTALKAVLDPEIGINIIDLGLVYEVEAEDDGTAKVLMTLTSMGCPLTEILHQQCTLVLTRLPGVTDVQVDFTFSPPWSTDMISPDAQDELRAMGFNV